MIAILPTSFSLACAQLNAFAHAEQLFDISAPNSEPELEAKLAAAKKIYLHFARLVHPDANPDHQKEAENAFKKLGQLYHQAQNLLDDRGPEHKQANGVLAKPVIFSTRKYHYTISQECLVGHTCTLFEGLAQGKEGDITALFKVPNVLADNDLMEREETSLRAIKRALRTLAEDANGVVWAEKFSYRIPPLLESVKLSEPGTTAQKRVNVFTKRVGNWYNLEQIRQAYPNGVEPRVAAFIFNRILHALTLAHSVGVIHGAVTPNHILVEPEEHHGMLIDWTASCKLDTKEQVPYLDDRYMAYFPEEIVKNGRLSPASDLYMAAWCVIYLLGGDPKECSIPDTVARPLRAVFNKCLQPKAIRRFQDAETLFQECGQVNRQLYGPARFVEFIMPPLRK